MAQTATGPHESPVPELPEHRPGAAESASMIATDLAQARLLAERAYYPHRLTFAARTPDSSLHMVLRAHDLTPDVTIGELGYRAPVRLDCGELGGFQITIPLRGTARSHCGDQSTIAGPKRAAVFTPWGDTSIELWSADCIQVAVRLAVPVIDEVLHQSAPHMPTTRTRFNHAYEIDSEQTRSWVHLVTSALDLIDALPSQGRQHVGPHLAKSIAVGFLHSADHNLRETLDRPAQAVPTKLLQRAIRRIEEHPSEPLDVAALAAHCGVSVRTLQYEFSRRLGSSPSAYRRRVALEFAHTELQSSDPGTATVGEIACRWGFFHLGRFARDYRKRYGVNPSEVLAAAGDQMARTAQTL